MSSDTLYNRSPIVTEDLKMDISNFTMKDQFWAINKLKRIEAPGPDGLPAEFLKETNEKQLELVLDLRKSWWNGAEITEEVTKAKVILLYKKRTNST